MKENWKKLNGVAMEKVKDKYILITWNAQNINARLSAIHFKKEHLYDIILYSSNYFLNLKIKIGRAHV